MKFLLWAWLKVSLRCPTSRERRQWHILLFKIERFFLFFVFFWAIITTPSRYSFSWICETVHAITWSQLLLLYFTNSWGSSLPVHLPRILRSSRLTFHSCAEADKGWKTESESGLGEGSPQKVWEESEEMVYVMVH